MNENIVNISFQMSYRKNNFSIPYEDMFHYKDYEIVERIINKRFGNTVAERRYSSYIISNSDDTGLIFHEICYQYMNTYSVIRRVTLSEIIKAISRGYYNNKTDDLVKANFRYIEDICRRNILLKDSGLLSLIKKFESSKAIKVIDKIFSTKQFYERLSC